MKRNPATAVSVIPAQDHPIAATTPADLLRIAISSGAGLDKMEKLMELQERWEANEARKAFVAAMVAFKAEPLAIGKNKHVSFNTSKGVTEYSHAELSDVTAVVVPALALHGISHGWQVHQDGKGITVTCTLTHALGHSQAVTMSAGADESGGKNPIQAVASANTYLQRYTLLASCGLATGGTDDDGRAAYADVSAVPDDVIEAENGQRQANRCQQVARANSESVDLIKDRIGADDVPAAIAEWKQFNEAEQRALWVPQSKGGVFNTAERAALRDGMSSTSRQVPDHE